VDARVLRQEINDIREDLKVLQRQRYGDSSGENNPEVKAGRLDELVRQTAGRLDEIEFRLKKLDEKIDMINKDIDVRMRLLEGKKVSNGGAAPLDNSPKFSAPVAHKAPETLTGGSITKSDDLQPLKATATVEEIYQSGLEAWKTGDFTTAEEKFNRVLQKFPTDKLAGNAQYWLAETYYSRKEFERSAVAFAKGYQDYKNGSKAADSLFKLGMSMNALGKKAEACAAFLSFRKEFPKADAALKAKNEAEIKKHGCK